MLYKHLPATAGERVTEHMRIGEPDDADPIGVPPGTFVAVEREGPLNSQLKARSINDLHSLRASETNGLGRPERGV